MTPIFCQMLFILVGFIQLGLQGCFILLLFNKKPEPKKVLLFAVAVMLLQQLPSYFIPSNLIYINMSIYILSVFFSIKYIFKCRLLNSLLGAVITLTTVSIIEYSTVPIWKLLSNNTFDALEWSKSPPLFLLMRSAGILLWLIAVGIAYYFRFRVNINQDINKKRFFSIAINIFIVFIIIISNISYYIQSMNRIPSYIFVYNAISLTVLLLFSIYSSTNLSKLDLKSQEVELQNMYIKTLTDSIEGLRGFKHDFNNIIQVLGGYLELNNIDGLKKYYSQIQGDNRKINNTFPLNSYVKDNPPIYGLLLSKISAAEINDISLNINIQSELDIRDIKTLDFYKMLGIFLDNALEAAFESEKKYVGIDIYKNLKSNNLIIEISNTFNSEIDIGKIFEDGFTTKSDHTGYGLWQVKKILQKYKFCKLGTNIRNKLFVQQLEIYY
jgi:two-component system, LytTR family, sensor histidine kinase AgrC